MSFGFDKEVPTVKRALEYAETHSVLVLASASNSGRNTTRGWPAQFDKVVCVHATDGDGTAYHLNPSPYSKAHNFAVLGESVQGWHPPDSKTGEPKSVYRSGTSSAAPIAAGIAAVLIRVLRHGQESYINGLLAHRKEGGRVRYDRHLNNIKAPGGMRELMAYMADGKERGGYHYFAPWVKLDFEQSNYNTTMIEDILNILDRSC